MELKKSKNKVPQKLKDRIQNLIGDFNTENINKNDIKVENYKAPEKENKLVEKSSPISLGSLKKELIKPITNIINEKLNNISFVTNKNTSNFTVKNYKNSINTSYKNFSPNSNVFKKFSTNTTFQSPQINQKYFNLDYKNLFSPSEKTEKNILNKFYNDDINLKNLTNNINLLPALKEGGVVKEPTVAYLHENEAVVPLKQSTQFQNFIEFITKGILNTSSKNENIKNILNIKNNTTDKSNKTTIENKNISNKKESANSEISFNTPITLTQQVEAPKDSMSEAKIPLVYGGSSSKIDFITGTTIKPKWRRNIG
jgi:hypothetical protein